MSEMKMSDMFELPVLASQLEVYGANSNPGITFEDIEKAAAHAINNHDRLVEENKRLREFVKQVADGDTACASLRQYMVHSYIHSAVKILEELEGDVE